jgi:hypothetical protein
MRSCALRILLAATICIALVIFCVLLKLAIFTRISFTPGMLQYVPVAANSSEIFFSVASFSGDSTGFACIASICCL